MLVNGVFAIVIGYFLGAIPSAYLMVRLVKGQDIRQLGSGTVGSFNTYRQAGAKAGVTVAIADPSHEDYQDMMTWLGGHFDPDSFDIEIANLKLKSMRV